ncbi:MAG: hypothetical protein ABI662_11160 [Dermatophilaceae bacterium]
MNADSGSVIRTSPSDEAPIQRLAMLRATLLDGRGPGASDGEVASHTRDRPWLSALPAPVERAQLDPQAGQLRAGEPIANRRVLRRERHRSLRALLLGGVLALALRAVARLARRRRRRLEPNASTTECRTLTRGGRP